MNTPPPASKRFAAIDGLRGVAALMVLWLHQAESFANWQLAAGRPVSLWDYLPGELGFGRTGVMVFFCISGFVICQSLQNGLRAFWINRVCRLYPLFWCSISLALIFFSGAFSEESYAWQLFGNITMVPGVLGVPLLMGIYWTLEIEMCFYLLATLFMAKGWLSEPKHYLAIIGVLVGVWFLMEVALPKDAPLPASMNDLVRRLPDNLSLMFWGGLCRLHFDAAHHPANSTSSQRNALLKLVWIGLAIMTLPRIVTVVVYYFRDSIHHLPNFVVCFVMSVALFAVVLRFGFFKQGFMVYLGRLSYGIYLFHPIAISLLGIWIVAPWFPSAFGAKSGLACILYVFVLSCLMAGILHYLVEQPAIALGRRLSAPFRKDRSVNGRARLRPSRF